MNTNTETTTDAGDLLFTENALIFAAFDICTYFGVDINEDDHTPIVIEEMIREHGERLVQVVPEGGAE
ncbi:MAG: hypothetical protein IT179_07910 [Acidobacteria bacterium]|nr:hypothetical protein [Acidobacteriota bacterium]